MRATHVLYRALPQAITDFVSGIVQYQFVSPLPVFDIIATEKLRTIVVTAPARIGALPTVVEHGFPELVIQDWIGLFVRRGTISQAYQPYNRGSLTGRHAKSDCRNLSV